jgi:hypothetical protein
MDGLILKTGSLLLLFSLFLVPTLAENDPDNCDNTGRYCFAQKLYDCVDGEPELVEICKYECNDAKCIIHRIEPNDTFMFVEPEIEEVQSSDVIFYISLVMVLGAIVIFGFKVRTRK